MFKDISVEQSNPPTDNADELASRRHAREALAAGTLPHRKPSRTWGGRGVGAQCSLCNQTIGQDEIEFELEFAPSNGGSSPSKYRFHMRCFEAWESERASSVGLPEAQGTGTIIGSERDTTNGRGSR